GALCATLPVPLVGRLTATLSPYTTLFRSEPRWLDAEEQKAWRAWLYSSLLLQDRLDRELAHDTGISHAYYEILVQLSEAPCRALDRKSTRLNSSHDQISYAVFCLKKKILL